MRQRDKRDVTKLEPTCHGLPHTLVPFLRYPITLLPEKS
jgi:hypothetical protein